MEKPIINIIDGDSELHYSASKKSNYSFKHKLPKSGKSRGLGQLAYKCTIQEGNGVNYDNPTTTFLINHIANYVFEECIQCINNRKNTSGKPSCSSPKNGLFVYNWTEIAEQVDKEVAEEAVNCKWTKEGKLGPEQMAFNKKSFIGRIKYDDETLRICSKENFTTALANACVFDGKWQYEVILGSKGVMQIGWATLDSQFSQENGVGDTPDSYAYDGNRQRKWNIKTLKYGDLWQPGDIITCLIDLELGHITYLRNGLNLGLAFDNIKVGQDETANVNIAYYPAISLALEENLQVNFGAKPFHYPQEGFQALVEPRVKQALAATTYLRWLTRLAQLKTCWPKDLHWQDVERACNDDHELCLMIVCQHIGCKLSPLITDPFVMEASVMPHLSAMVAVMPYKKDLLFAFIDYLLCILQERQTMAFLSHWMQSIETSLTCSSSHPNYDRQLRCHQMLQTLLPHHKLRAGVVKYVLFKNSRFLSLINLKPFSPEHLKESNKIDFFSSKFGDFSKGDSDHFHNMINEIENSIDDMEMSQLKTLRLLLTREDDVGFHDTTRAVFLAKFRYFIKDNFLFKNDLSNFTKLSCSDVLNLCFRLFDLFKDLWENEVGELTENIVSANIFYDGKLLFYDTNRLGGSESHLKNTFKEEIEAAQVLLNQQQLNDTFNSDSSTSDFVELESEENISDDSEDVVLDISEGVRKRSRGRELAKESRRSLLALLDGIVILYHYGVHRQMEKTVAESNSYFDNVQHYQQLTRKMMNILPNGPPSVVKELELSLHVMEKKIKEQSYQNSWSLASNLSNKTIGKQLQLLSLINGALNNADTEGDLFQFVPEYYIDAVADICQDLRNVIVSPDDKQPTIQDHDAGRDLHALVRVGGHSIVPRISQDYFRLLVNVSEFLSTHFVDSRIVYADSKDAVVQTLAEIVCHRLSLKALESIPSMSREKMVVSLLFPYEDRAWAQNNWILVRLWKGKGFGYRYTKSPHLVDKLGPKPSFCEIPNLIQATVPRPSDVYLTQLKEAFSDPAIASPFLNSLLNQLNWVFSEFIGMIQEIQNASNRPERVFIESRQLRICATCFDLTLALLRVLELTVSLAPNIFTDALRADSQTLLLRLCQLLCQVLNRTSVQAGCFRHVVNLDIPGLESIHYFPILTAVAGILCRLLEDDIYVKKDCVSPNFTATRQLLGEASFQICSIYPLICNRDSLHPWSEERPISPDYAMEEDTPTFPYHEVPTDANCLDVSNLFKEKLCGCQLPKFCLRKSNDSVRPYEIRKVVDVIHHLETFKDNMSASVDSDSLCTICYANTQDTRFIPCGHNSCRVCIEHHLMNKTECFFCKAEILKVIETTTLDPIYNSIEK